MLTNVAFGRVIRHRIQNPISKLIHGTRQVADLNTADIHLENEMGDLARSFKNLALRIN